MKLMRRINRTRILSLVQDGAVTTRVRLAQRTGLDGTTITNLVRSLANDRLLVHRGYDRSTGGRRAERLALNSDWRWTIGLYLGPRQAVGVLADLRGSVRARTEIGLSPAAAVTAPAAALRELTSRLCADAGSVGILGAGLAVTGMLDRERCRLVQSGFFPALEGLDLAAHIRAAGAGEIAAVAIDTSARCLALCEHRFGAARGLRNFLFLELGRGIGCAIVSNGRLLRGASAGAGELGHTAVAPNGGRRCSCGHRGCLETVAAVGALEADAAPLLKRRAPDLAAIKAACAADHAPVLALVRRAGRTIGLGASCLVNVLNPSHIVVGGELAQLGPVLLAAIDTALREHSMSASYAELRTLPAAFPESTGAALGAAALVIDTVFAVPVTAVPRMEDAPC